MLEACKILNWLPLARLLKLLKLGDLYQHEHAHEVAGRYRGEERRADRGSADASDAPVEEESGMRATRACGVSKAAREEGGGSADHYAMAKEHGSVLGKWVQACLCGGATSDLCSGSIPVCDDDTRDAEGAGAAGRAESSMRWPEEVCLLVLRVLRGLAWQRMVTCSTGSNRRTRTCPSLESNRGENSWDGGNARTDAATQSLWMAGAWAGLMESSVFAIDCLLLHVDAHPVEELQHLHAFFGADDRSRKQKDVLSVIAGASHIANKLAVGAPITLELRYLNVMRQICGGGLQGCMGCLLFAHKQCRVHLPASGLRDSVFMSISRQVRGGTLHLPVCVYACSSPDYTRRG